MNGYLPPELVAENRRIRAEQRAATNGHPEPSAVARMANRNVTFTAASAIRPRRARWLWPNRLPLGGFGLFAGDGGLGKSVVALDTAARITRGTLPGEYFGTPMCVAVVATEDAWPEVIVPRLMAADADLERVLRCSVLDKKGVDIGSVELSLDLDQLRLLITTHDVVLTILDPVTSRMGRNLDTHKDADVRLALEPFSQMLFDTRTSGLGLIHFNKGSGGSVLGKIMGSTAFGAVARTVTMFAEDPDDRGLRLFETVKNNWGQVDLPTLSYRVVSREVEIPDDERPGNTAAVRWESGESATTVRDVLALDVGGRRPSSTTVKAEQWLREHMKAVRRELKSAVALAAEEEEGIGMKTLEKVREKAGVSYVREGFGGPVYWLAEDWDPMRDTAALAQ